MLHLPGIICRKELAVRKSDRAGAMRSIFPLRSLFLGHSHQIVALWNCQGPWPHRCGLAPLRCQDHRRLLTARTGFAEVVA